jgi:hypothetical protein
VLVFERLRSPRPDAHADADADADAEGTFPAGPVFGSG